MPQQKPRDLDHIENLDSELWELYDLKNDRTETNDVSGQYPQKVKEMSDRERNSSQLIQNLMVPMTKQPQVDSYLHQYFEVTLAEQNHYIDFA